MDLFLTFLFLLALFAGFMGILIALHYIFKDISGDLRFHFDEEDKEEDGD